MARARNIKPAIMDNEVLGALSPLHRLLFVYLWMLADREGRLEDRPARIAVKALPYDREADVGSMLDDLAQRGFVVRYRAADLDCIQVLAFAKHQTPHCREAPSTLPAYVPGTTKAVPQHDQGSASTSPRSPDSLIPDSLNPDSLNEDAAKPEASTPLAAPPTVRAKEKKPAKVSMPTGFGISERVQAWATDKGHGRLAEHLEHFIGKARASGYQYADWDQALMNAIREDWAGLRREGVGARNATRHSSHSGFEAVDYQEGIQA